MVLVTGSKYNSLETRVAEWLTSLTVRSVVMGLSQLMARGGVHRLHLLIRAFAVEIDVNSQITTTTAKVSRGPIHEKSWQNLRLNLAMF